MNGQWNTVYLPEICEIKTGKHDANHAVNNGKYRFYTCSSEFSMCDTTSFSGESVIVPGNGDIGLVFYYNGDFDAYQRTYVLNNIKINAKFLYYHMLHNWRSRNENKQFGSTIRYVRMSNFTNYTISFPASYEQQRIVDKIEELFSKLDKGVEELNKIKEQLKIYRQAVLKEAFQKCDDDKRVVEVCEYVTDGDHMPPPKADKGIPFIMISNIKNNTIDFENTSFVQEGYYNNIGNKRTPQIGDVLYTVTGSYGIPVLVDFNKKFCFQRHIALLRPNDLVEQKFLYYVMQTPDVYQQATKRATGTAQKTVGLAVLRDIKIPYICKELQKNIVCDIESKLSVCDKIEQTVNESLQKAESLRQSILKQAFEGKLV